MSTITLMNYDSQELEDLDQCEKIQRRQRAVMPVHVSHSAISGSHRTPASRRASRRTSGCKGGIHHRRRRRTG